MNDYQTIPLNLNGETFEATPYNSRLYTFVGKSLLENGDTVELSSRNHIFLKTGEIHVDDQGREVTTGTYIFGEAVGRIGAVMLHHQFPAELNSREVHPNDEQAYQSYVAHQEPDVEDYVPDWMIGGEDGA